MSHACWIIRHPRIWSEEKEIWLMIPIYNPPENRPRDFQIQLNISRVINSDNKFSFFVFWVGEALGHNLMVHLGYMLRGHLYQCLKDHVVPRIRHRPPLSKASPLVHWNPDFQRTDCNPQLKSLVSVVQWERKCLVAINTENIAEFYSTVPCGQEDWLKTLEFVLLFFLLVTSPPPLQILARCKTVQGETAYLSLYYN